MRLIIADDHALVRESIGMFLRAAQPEWLIDEASDHEGLVSRLSESAADLAMVDLSMPGLDGGVTLGLLRERFPNCKILVITGDERRQTILDCLSAGVHGYIFKTASSSTLLSAIRTVLSGSVYVPSQLSSAAGTSSTNLTGGEGQRIQLTTRQKEVLELLGEGLSTKAIARRLSLGLGTVKVHLAGAYKALGAHSRFEASLKVMAIKAEDLRPVGSGS